MVEIMRTCPDCKQPQYGWDGLTRHYVRGWCKVAGKISEESARDKVGAAINVYLHNKDLEYQQDEAYDRKHNLGAYSH